MSRVPLDILAKATLVVATVLVLPCVARAESYSYDRQWAVAQPGAITPDRAGGVLITDLVGRRIQRFDCYGALLGQWGGYGSGDGQFLFPTGAATDDSGNVYVADGDAMCVFKFTSAGEFVSRWGTAGQFRHPVAVAWHDGVVFVSDFDRVRRFDGNGTPLGQWGSPGSGPGQFSEIFGLALDSQGHVYVTDLYNDRVQKFDANGLFLCQWGDSGCANGQFRSPVGIATDAAGNVYVADRDNYRIQKFDGAGRFLSQWGSMGRGEGEFTWPIEVMVGNDDCVYVSDNDRIQVFAPAVATPVTRTTWGALKARYR